MFKKNKGNTPYYFCFAAGIYMAYIVYRMVTQLEGALEPKHWILGIILGLLALGMIGYGGYFLFFRKAGSRQEEAESAPEKEE